MNNECTWSRILILILDDWTRSIENREKRKWVQAGWQDDTVAMRLSLCHMNSDVRNCRCFLQLQELTIRFVTRDFQAWNHIVNLIYIHLCLYIYLSISTYISRVCRTDLSSRRTPKARLRRTSKLVVAGSIIINKASACLTHNCASNPFLTLQFFHLINLFYSIWISLSIIRNLDYLLQLFRIPAI